MNIQWYGQACFRIESKDMRILIDPFSKDIGLRPPRFNDNIYLITHNHYDHNNIEGVSDDAFVITGPGEYEKQGVQIIGIKSFHDDVQGSERGYNTIYIIRIEDITICHLGDLGQNKLTDDQLSIIGDIDVLFIPVGGTYTIDGKQAVGIVNQLQPKIIVPMHYKVKDLNIKLDDNTLFIKEMGIKPQEVDVLKLNAKTLPTEETQLYTIKF